MANRDLSNMETLPPGMPLFGLDKPPVLLKLAIITEADKGDGTPQRMFVGLVVKSWLVVPLDYVDDLDAGLVALKTIISGFTRLGFKVIPTEVLEGE